MMATSSLAVLVALLAPSALASAVAAAPAAAVLVHSGADYTLANGFVSATFTTGRLLRPGPALSSLKGDFEGVGDYGEELLAPAGYKLEAVAPDGTVVGSDAAPTVKIVSHGGANAAILVSGVSAGGAVEVWFLSLAAGSRFLSLNTTGTMGGVGVGSATSGATLVRHVLAATPLSVYGCRHSPRRTPPCALATRRTKSRGLACARVCGRSQRRRKIHR